MGDGADNVRTYLTRTGGEGQPSSVMLSNPDLAAAFKTSVYNTVQFSAATSKAMGMTRVPSPSAHLHCVSAVSCSSSASCFNCHLIEMGSAITLADGRCSLCGRDTAAWH